MKFLSIPMDVGAARAAAEALLEKRGAGRYSLGVLCLCGFGWMSDGAENVVLSYMLPTLEDLWSLSPSQLGAMSTAIYFGQAAGATFWGALADAGGRRPVFLLSLALTVLFGVASSAAPGFYTYCMLRLATGFAIGGAAVLSRRPGRGPSRDAGRPPQGTCPSPSRSPRSCCRPPFATAASSRFSCSTRLAAWEAPASPLCCCPADGASTSAWSRCPRLRCSRRPPSRCPRAPSGSSRRGGAARRRRSSPASAREGAASRGCFPAAGRSRRQTRRAASSRRAAAARAAMAMGPSGCHRPGMIAPTGLGALASPSAARTGSAARCDPCVASASRRSGQPRRCWRRCGLRPTLAAAGGPGLPSWQSGRAWRPPPCTWR